MQSRIRLAAHSFLWTGHFTQADAIFAEAASCGYEGVELAVADLDCVDWQSVSRAQARHGLEVVLCAAQPSGRTLASHNEGVRAKAVAHVQAALEQAQALGGTILTGPLLYPVGTFTGAAPTDEERTLLQDSLKRIAELAERMDMRVALEPLNRFQGYLLTCVDDGLLLCRGSGSTRIGLLLDVFHMNIEEPDTAAAIRKAAERCFHLHVSARNRDVPGSDTFDWASWRQAVDDIGYEGWVTVEAFCFTDAEAAVKAHLWHPPKRTPLDGARASIEHLKTLI